MGDTLEKDLENHFRIKTQCIWIETFEEQKALSIIRKAIIKLQAEQAKTCSNNKPQQLQRYEAFEWSAGIGGYKINLINGERIVSYEDSNDNLDLDVESPLTEIPPTIYALLASIRTIQEQKDAPPTLFILKEFTGIINGAEQQRYIRDIKERLSVKDETYTPIIVIAPMATIPFSLQKLFVTLKLPLPDTETILSYIDSYVGKNAINSNATERENIARAACGLTSLEIIRAFNMSYLLKGSLDATMIINEKIQTIQKSGILTYRQPKQTLNSIGGHGALKDWIRETKLCMTDQAKEFGIKHARGYISVGYPGAGKTAIAEAIAEYFGVPFVVLDLSKIMGGIVGESERTARQAFEIIDALGDAVVLIDEAEKQLGGISSSNKSDGGTLARVFNVILDHLNENERQFYILTSNDISQLPSALTRAGRLDNKWFFDFPTQKDRKDIFDIHFKNAKKNISDEQLIYAAGRSIRFTGAEIANAVNNIIRTVYFKLLDKTGDGTITDNDIAEGIDMVSTVAKTSPAEVNSLKAYVTKNDIRSTTVFERTSSTKAQAKEEKADEDFLSRLMADDRINRREVI